MDTPTARRKPFIACPALLFSAACAFHGAPVLAATYIVGTGSGCTHSTLASAITAAESSPGPDTIRLTRSIAYTQVAATITTSQQLDLVGGFATCAQAEPDGPLTVLDGAGGAAEPVLRITGNTGAVVRLASLTIRNGDEDGTGYGGGIHFRGDGTLEIAHTAIAQNTAGYGGGIYAEGLGPNARLVVGADVSIASNTARYSGGGIYLEGMRMSMTEPGSVMLLNRAMGTTVGGVLTGGYGGGLMVLTGTHSAVATLGSTGPGHIGVLYQNEAVYGGGAAVIAADDDHAEGRIVIAGTDPDHGVGVVGNTSSLGGGLYGRPYCTTVGGCVNANFYLRNFSISDNTASDGAAIYLADDEATIGNRGSSLFSLTSQGSGLCLPGRACGEISRNLATGSSSGGGAIIRMRGNTRLALGEVGFGLQTQWGAVMRANQGQRLIYASNNDTRVQLDNLLIADNVVGQELIRHAGENFSEFILRNVTIAGNQIGAGHVLAKHERTTIEASLIWQPGKTTLQSSGGSLDVAQVIASEVASLAAGPEAVVAEPRFTDPARGDYTLRAASPAVDAALPTGEIVRDALGNPRDVDLPVKLNSRGSRDIGAFERQALYPLVLNGDFDADMNLWTEVFSGVSSWTNEQNTVGATGSGSIKVSQTNVAYGQAIRGRRQCIHLPGPGIYALNGSGRGTGNFTVPGDIAQLNWEYRRNGGEACTQGAPTSSGTLVLSNRAGWSRAFAPARIVVTPAEWMYVSSISIELVGVESGVSGEPRTTNTWFDGITLEIEGSDTLFRTGFDP